VETSSYKCVDPIAAAFLCGLACADEAHLSALPETLVDALRLDYAEIEVTPVEGAPVRHSHPERELEEESGRDGRFEFRGSLRGKAGLRIYAHVAGDRGLSDGQRQSLARIADLAVRMLECVLVQQHDRQQLGHGFEKLSDREWEACRMLESTDSEKEIAAKLLRSRFTLHARVKKVYLTLGVTSRKQVVGLLNKARKKLQIETLRQICFQEETLSSLEQE